MQMELRLFNSAKQALVLTEKADVDVRPEVMIGRDGVRYLLDPYSHDHRGDVHLFDYVRERTLRVR